MIVRMFCPIIATKTSSLSGLGFSPLRTGISFVPFSIGIIFGSMFASPLGQLYGRAAVGAGTLVMTAALASMIAVISHYAASLHAWQLTPSLTIAGVAFGIVSGTLAKVVLGHVPARLADGASGVVNTVIQLGSVLAIAVVGAISFDSVGHRPDSHTFVHATTSGLWYLAGACALASIGTMALPGRRPHASATNQARIR